MTGARRLLYAHCLAVLACGGLAVFALERRANSDWRFDRWLEVFIASPVGTWTLLVCLLSCFAFPFGVAYKAVGRMSAWRWGPVVAVDVILGQVQYAAL